jgi:cytochrome c553
MNIRNFSRRGFGLPLAILAVVSAHAQGHAGVPPVVTGTCSGCHGIDGSSQISYIPRLSGLSASYLEHKMAGFRAAAESPVDEALNRIFHIGNPARNAGFSAAATSEMIGIANAISDKDMKDAVQWYASREAAHGRGGSERRFEEGRSLFAAGSQSQGLVACQACHGLEAQGTAGAPRLAGQHAIYLLAQLSVFRAGGDQNSPMTPIARSIRADQAQALAQYLQSADQPAAQRRAAVTGRR